MYPDSSNGALSARTTGRPLAYSGEANQKTATEREIGSVERELAKMSEAVMSLESALAAHAGRLEPVMLMTPGPGAGKDSAPDVAVCGVADRVRTMRRRLEDLTGQLSYLTIHIDL